MRNENSPTHAAERAADLTLPKLKNAPTKTRRMAREREPDGLGAGTLEIDKPQASAAPRGTKSAAVLGLLKRQQGATLTELIEATGWLAHSTRAALTGLRKKGHAIERGSRDGISFYQLPAK